MPAVSVTGLANVKVLRPPAPPSLKPGNVAVARSAPVGTGVAPVVARIESVMFGLFAVQQAEELEVDPLQLAGDGRRERLAGPAVL